ncbi:MAG: hypothetical protein KF788_01370 [Piscinibacter sp.]|nr:hypothetical protein [Piscinibacter sp.]
MLSLAAASLGAGAQAQPEAGVVWIENQSFGFEACAGGAAADAVVALDTLRRQAAGQVAEAVRLAGVVPGAAQQLTMTPVEGRFACGARADEATFRIAAVDAATGKFWSADLKVRAEVLALADDLARSFRGVVVSQSALR